MPRTEPKIVANALTLKKKMTAVHLITCLIKDVSVELLPAKLPRKAAAQAMATLDFATRSGTFQLRTYAYPKWIK